MPASSAPVALVTGASTGIGHATALLLARNGYRVFASVRRPEAGTQLQAEGAGLSLEILPAELALDDAGPALAAQVLARAGRIDLLVNNAGFAILGAMEDLPISDLRRQFQVNVFAVADLCRAVLPTMRRQGSGRIVNVSSLAGRVSVPLMGAYCATKFALEALSDAMRAEERPFGVRVVLVEPGPVRTEFNRSAVRGSLPILRSDSPFRPVYESYLRDYETRWAASPEKVARVILRAARASHPRARYRPRLMEAALAGLVQIVPKGAMDFATIRFAGLHKLSRP